MTLGKNTVTPLLSPSSRALPSKVLDDRTLDVRGSSERPITHALVLVQRAAEGVEFPPARFHLGHLANEQVPYVTTPHAARVALVAHQLANLPKGQAVRLRLPDEPYAVDDTAVVLSEAT